MNTKAKIIVPPKAPAVNLVGQKFGLLTVVEFLGIQNRKGRWGLQCECGKLTEVYTFALKGLESCGCKRLKDHINRITTHGQSKSKEYGVWEEMVQRTTNPNNPSYHNYGGRGIGICDRWRFGEGGKSGFECFIEDVGHRPSSKHCIERKDNNGNYEPSNCVWATRKEENNNTRWNRIVEYMGKSQSVALWADELGMDYATLSTRIRRGWSVERAFTAQVNHKNLYL